MLQNLTSDLQQIMPMAVSTGLFQSLASFAAPTLTQGPTGNPTGDLAPVGGLQDIPCLDAPESELRVQATEMKTLQDILSKNLRHVLLRGYYPQLFQAAELGWVCSIDGVAYDLLGAEADSQRIMTRCRLQRVEL